MGGTGPGSKDRVVSLVGQIYADANLSSRTHREGVFEEGVDDGLAGVTVRVVGVRILKSRPMTAVYLKLLPTRNSLAFIFSPQS